MLVAFTLSALAQARVCDVITLFNRRPTENIRSRYEITLVAFTWSALAQARVRNVITPCSREDQLKIYKAQIQKKLSKISKNCLDIIEGKSVLIWWMFEQRLTVKHWPIYEVWSSLSVTEWADRLCRPPMDFNSKNNILKVKKSFHVSAIPS